jgi:hypothetical protein
MMSEVTLSRVEELLRRIADESRPALAVGDPAMPLVDRSHFSSNVAAGV